MKKIIYIFFICLSSTVFGQHADIGVGLVFMNVGGQRIKSISSNAAQPSYVLKEVEDKFKFVTITGGYYHVLKDLSEQSTFGLYGALHGTYGVGRQGNVEGWTGTYFWSIQHHGYAMYKIGRGATLTQQFGRQSTGTIGGGAGIGYHYLYGASDYYFPEFRFSYFRPAFTLEFSKDTERGLLRFRFFKSFIRSNNKLYGSLGKIKTYSYTDMGFSASYVINL